MSRRKGKRWEQQLAALLRPIFHPIEIKRGIAQARDGAGEAADIDGVPRMWIEAKHGKLVNLRAALAQAERAMAEARERELVADPMNVRPKEALWPIAICKDNHDRPVVVMRLDDWLQLITEWWCGVAPPTRKPPA